MTPPSFRRTIAWIIAGSFAAAAAMEFPGTVHDWMMSRRVESLQALASAELGPAPTFDQADAWLVRQGFATTHPQPYFFPSKTAIHGELLLADGCIFWKRTQAAVLFQFSTAGPYREAHWWVDDRRLSKSDGLLRGINGAPLFLGGGMIILLMRRRTIRRRRGQCPACAYPVGQSAVCTECGAAVMPAAPRAGIQ